MVLAHPIRRAQSGSALAEFVVLLPCMLLLFFTVSEGASMVTTHQVLNNACREGARLSVVPGELGDTTGIVGRVVAYANNNGVPIAASNVNVNQADIVSVNGGGCTISNPCLTASQVTVTYAYPLHYLSSLPFGLPSTVSLSAAVAMRNFY